MHLIFASTISFCILQLVLGNAIESRTGTKYDGDDGNLEQQVSIAKRGTTILDLLSEVFDKLEYLEEQVEELKEGNKIESCPDGWYKHGTSCYFFSDYALDWFDSLVVCMAFQGYLAEINGASENVYLKNKVKKENDDFWIGATDLVKENHWIWVTSQTRLTTSMFLDWIENEPNNSGEEHCLVLRLATDGWNDYKCNLSRKFICERELKSDK